MAAALPGDLWCLVSDFVGPGPLGQVCRAVRGSVGRRHAAYRVTPATAALLSAIEGDKTIKTLALHCARLKDDGVAALAALASLAGCEALRLSLENCCCTDAFAMAPLRPIAQLARLTLDTQDSYMGRRGATALAALGAGPALSSLRLYLRAGHLGPEGLRLVAEGWGPALQDLELDVHDNQLGPAGLLGLAPLARCRGLRALSLSLGSNQLTGTALPALGALEYLPALASLRLDLASNGIGDAALAHVVPALPALQSLTLNLWGNDVGEAGAAALAAKAAQLPSLTVLDLDLGHNRMEGAATLGLLPLFGNPALARLALRLEDNGVDASGLALGPALAAGSVTHLALYLGYNFVMDNGAEALAALRTAGLQSLVLSLPGNFITDRGAAALSTFCEVAVRMQVRMDVADNRLSANVQHQLSSLLPLEPPPFAPF